ncbi:Riboflavin synthase eubacterial/eukaryotic [hydrothermal vent metagenome]|uniref:Riboflavin synthase n=1 Tax=hydrothermal vent metagenome TaxID=652676 RepID=A0A3B1E506_9ZZZZ
MFTGLIREVAMIIRFTNNILTVKSEYRPKLGDSIAINGACLTVISIAKNTFSVELSDESQKILDVQNYTKYVHIEPAMIMNDRFEGHIVQGHIDCIGQIISIKKNTNSTDFIIKLPQEFMRFIVSKGSITINGISLTINDVNFQSNTFRITIISYTLNNTLFKTYKVNHMVNIETDMFAKYILNIIQNNSYSILKQNEISLSWTNVDRIMSNY